MNSSLLFLTLLTLLLLPNPSSSSSPDPFEAWCKEYGKSYHSDYEELYRHSVFAQNLAMISEYNEMGFSYTLALNAFADMTLEEIWGSRFGFMAVFLTDEHFDVKKTILGGDVPSEMDWRERGAVTGVKDQGSCASSWAFSAIGAIEGINKIVTGSLISLSEQELMDCNKGPTAGGCIGGQVSSAFQFVIKNKGIDADRDYPYQAQDMDCNEEKVNRRFVTIDSFEYVPLYDEEQLLQAVARQPVSASIVASSFAFLFYSKGIITNPYQSSLDHASLDHVVLIVGYGSENGVDYWILKNSWGENWGMNGYMYLQRDHGNREGLFGINMLALYPIKTSANPPPPGPVYCDTLWQCNGGETCCCWMPFLKTCISWTCCDNFGVCCEDHIHCCPPDYPICDTEKKLCFQAYGNLTVKVLESRSGAKKSGTGIVSGKSRRQRIPLIDDSDDEHIRPNNPLLSYMMVDKSLFLPGSNSSVDCIPNDSFLYSSYII